MSDNYVSISLRAEDGAKPDLDALKLALDDLKGRVAEAKADVDTKDGQAALLALEATLDAVSKKVASPRIDMAGASRALAQVAAVDVALDELKAKSDKEGAEGVIGRFLMGSGGSGGMLGGLTSVLGKLPLVGDQLAGIGEQAGQAGGESGGLAESLGSVAGAGPGIAIVGGIIGAAATEAAALASGFTAAGLGVGGFAALALPTLKEVFGAVGDTKAQLDKLPEPIRMAVTEVKNVKAQFEGMAKSFQIPTVQVLSQALGIISDHMGLIKTFADAALPAIEKVLGMLSKGLDSTAFKDFTGYMSKLSGPAIEAIGSGMAGLAKDVMQLLTVMSRKDVINGINIAFRLIGFALTAVIDIIKVSMGAWDMLTKYIHLTAAAFDLVRHAVATAGHDIATAFDAVRHVAATAGHDVASAFDAARHAVATAGHDITAALDAVVKWVSSHWKEILAWLVSPIGMAVYEIKTHTHEIAQAFDQLRHDIAAILAGVRHDISSAWDAIRHDVASFVNAIPGTVKNAFNDVYQFIKTVDTDILHALQTAWNAVVSAVSTAVKDVLSFFEKLPGQVTGYLDKLPGQMLTAGKNIIDGLINGIKNAAADIPGIMKSLASDVASYFTDPLKIFSPSKVFEGYGQNVVQGAINGVQQTAPKLRSTMSQLGTQVARTGLGTGGAAGAAGGSGGGQLVLQVQGSNGGLDGLFMTWLKNSVRAAGGDPAMFTRKVAFAS